MIPKTSPAIVFEAPNVIGIRSFDLAPMGESEITVRTLYSMVSSGTELRVLGGHYGAEGKFPLVPGYSIVGEVIGVGDKARGYRVGDLISGRNPRSLVGVHSHWGGQSAFHVYSTRGEDRPVILPAGARPLDYVIAEIAAIPLRGVDSAAPVPGESAVVLGQGLIGALSAAWRHARGCRVLVADLEPARLERAMAWGASASVRISEPDAVDRIHAWCNGGADIVVESSGSSAGIKTASGLVRKKPQAYGTDYKVEPITFYHRDWPRLIVQANYLADVSINPQTFFPGEGIIILTPSDRGVEDRQRSVEEIRRGTIKASDFVQNIVRYTDAAKAYVALRDDKNSNFSLVFDWT